jgi:hypothetical protein
MESEPTERTCPAFPEEFARLEEEAKHLLGGSSAEYLAHSEKLRQAYYGYTSESCPKFVPVFTVVDTRTNRIIYRTPLLEPS